MVDRGRRPLIPSDPTSVLPVREWSRGTELVKLFLATGFIENCRPASLIFVGEPGTGKTELLERFRKNKNCSFHSDITVRQLFPVLKQVNRGVVTHLVLTEFQKLMQRKMAVAENLLGTLVQAMEEGVQAVSVGPGHTEYGGVRVGVVGAITNGTIAKRRDFLSEMGFLSRAATFEWDLPPEEELEIMGKISRGDFADLEPIQLPRPVRAVHVELAESHSNALASYVWESRKGKAIRHFNRLRALAQASAFLDGRDVVNALDVEWIRGFHSYWQKMLD